ncbi:MAG: hypothetical protein KA174_05225 [Chitinophagales bacterium]|nr:hypothetical protein [Chitinophagales bacterium]
MKKLLHFFLLSTINFALIAQNVGINTTGVAPAASAGLDVNFSDKGILIPNVALTALNLAGPITTPATSLLVYNTATANTGVAAPPNNISPGYYYWNSTNWVKLSTFSANPWLLNGNTSITTPTTPATYGTSTILASESYLGTTDANDVVLATNNIERFRLKQTTGNIGIGLSAPTTKFEVSSGATVDAIYGHSNNVGGYLGKETNFTVGTAGTIQGAGVWAANPTAGYTSSYAQSSGAATVAANINFSSVWIASYNLVDNGSATSNPSALYGQLNNTNGTMGPGAFKNALYGYSNRGTTTGNPGYTVGVNGTANSQNEDGIGVVGRSFCSSGFSIGGYFEGNTYPGVNIGYAYVGGNDGLGVTKITGLGAVSEIVPTPNHGRVTLTCPESPEYWYQDYGTVTLTNGRAHVDLDPILVDVIFVDEENPMRVFCTPVNMRYFNGVTIENQTTTGFDIIELNDGNHTGKIDYQVVVKPRTNFGVGRFPQAPGPAYLKSDKEPAAAKAANNPKDGRKIFYWPADSEVYNYKPEDLVGVGEIVQAGKYRGMVKMADGTFKEVSMMDKSTFAK